MKSRQMCLGKAHPSPDGGEPSTLRGLIALLPVCPLPAAALLFYFSLLFSFAALLFCSDRALGDRFASDRLGGSRAAPLLSPLPGVRRPFFSPFILAL